MCVRARARALHSSRKGEKERRIIGKGKKKKREGDESANSVKFGDL